MIKYITAPMMGLLSCLPIDCTGTDAPKPKPPCTEQHIILDGPDSPTLCDVSPPQVLSYWLDDPGPIQEQDCLDAGGQIMTDDLVERTLCLDIDY